MKNKNFDGKNITGFNSLIVQNKKISEEIIWNRTEKLMYNKLLHLTGN